MKQYSMAVLGGLLSIGAVSGQMENMNMGSGMNCPMMNMMGGGMGSFAGWLYFIIAAFVFCVILWLTRNWLVKDKRR